MPATGPMPLRKYPKDDVRSLQKMSLDRLKVQIQLAENSETVDPTEIARLEAISQKAVFKVFELIEKGLFMRKDVDEKYDAQEEFMRTIWHVADEEERDRLIARAMADRVISRMSKATILKYWDKVRGEVANGEEMAEADARSLPRQDGEDGEVCEDDGTDEGDHF